MNAPKPGTLEEARRAYNISKIGLFQYSHRDSLPIEGSRLELHDAVVIALVAAERADAAKSAVNSTLDEALNSGDGVYRP